VTPRLSSPLVALESSVRHGRDRRPVLHVLHVGKTGGTAVNHALGPHGEQTTHRLLFEGHQATLRDVRRGESFMFFLRDPVSRFVSAFNSRLREGRPRYHYPWREAERIAFARFSTPDALASALSSDDDAERGHAIEAMRGIGHVNTPYSFWFGSEEAFRTRLPDLFFVGFQEQLDGDFELLAQKLGLLTTVRLPADDTSAHRTTKGHETELSAKARANLEEWYESDRAFVRVCREIAPAVNRGH